MYDLLRVQKDIITSQSVTTVATPSKIFDNLTLDFFFNSASSGSQLCVVITLPVMPRLIYDSAAGCCYDETLFFYVKRAAAP